MTPAAVARELNTTSSFARCGVQFSNHTSVSVESMSVCVLKRNWCQLTLLFLAISEYFRIKVFRIKKKKYTQHSWIWQRGLTGLKNNVVLAVIMQEITADILIQVERAYTVRTPSCMCSNVCTILSRSTMTVP